MITNCNSIRKLSSPSNIANEGLERWESSQSISEVPRASPQPHFTQVTMPFFQSRSCCHQNPDTTRHNSDTERQKGDLVRGSSRNENRRYKSQRSPPNNTRTKTINDINHMQWLPPMSSGTYSCLYRPYQHDASWIDIPSPIQVPYLNNREPGSNKFGRFDPCVATGQPLTPAAHSQADHSPQHTSLISRVSQLASPRICDTAPVSRSSNSGLNAAFFSKVDNVHEPQWIRKRLPTPPPEPARSSVKRPGQAIQEQQRAAFDENDHHTSEESNAIGDGKHDYDPTALGMAGADPELDFLSHDWNPGNFEFLADSGGYNNLFSSDTDPSWDMQENQLPSTYPALPPDSGYSSDRTFGFDNLQQRSIYPPEASLDPDFDQFAGYMQSQSSMGTTPFENSCTPFETHGFPTQTGSSQRSKSKDQLLVDLKQKGYSYKEIKDMGQFDEAESTLRGRYRTLTKPKEARVRKPEWGDREVALLLQAVKAHTNTSADEHHPPSYSAASRSASTMSRRANKIPWKQVAEYMALRGAYKYGNATVKKKWTEIMEAEPEAGR